MPYSTDPSTEKVSSPADLVRFLKALLVSYEQSERSLGEELSPDELEPAESVSLTASVKEFLTRLIAASSQADLAHQQPSWRAFASLLAFAAGAAHLPGDKHAS